MFINYAHRGASEYAPENTLSSFFMGAAMGANGIETDIQLTKDGIPVLFHDDSLKRVTGVDALLSALSLMRGLPAKYTPRLLGALAPSSSPPVSTPTPQPQKNLALSILSGLYWVLVTARWCCANLAGLGLTRLLCLIHFVYRMCSFSA
jgi:hypothetical protein